MGYWVAGQLRTMGISVIYNIKFRKGNMILGRVLIIPCEILLRDQLRNTRSIDLLVSGRGRVDGLEDAL